VSNQSSSAHLIASPTHHHHHHHHHPLVSLQAQAVQDHIRANNIRVDLVIVSPLTRALETAVGCFGNLSGPLNGTAPLMAALTEVPGVRTAHPAVGAEGCPPFVCYELCREHLGVHPCDKRYPIGLKQQMFPGGELAGGRFGRGWGVAGREGWPAGCMAAAMVCCCCKSSHQAAPQLSSHPGGSGAPQHVSRSAAVLRSQVGCSGCQSPPPPHTRHDHTGPAGLCDSDTGLLTSLSSQNCACSLPHLALS